MPCIHSWTECGNKESMREELDRGVSVWEGGEKTVESKSSFPADFNLSAGWARQFRPYSSRQSRRVTASRAAGGGWGMGDGRTLCYVSVTVVCLWNMLSMLKRKWLSGWDAWTEDEEEERGKQIVALWCETFKKLTGNRNIYKIEHFSNVSPTKHSDADPSVLFLCHLQISSLLQSVLVDLN